MVEYYQGKDIIMDYENHSFPKSGVGSGAGVGLTTTTGLEAIDAQVTKPTFSSSARDQIQSTLPLSYVYPSPTKPTLLICLSIRHHVRSLYTYVLGCVDPIGEVVISI